MTPWTVACQAPLSMEFSRQEYWSGLPFPSPKGRIPDMYLSFNIIGAVLLSRKDVLSHFSRVQHCSTVDSNPTGSSVHGILQARGLEWVALPSRGSSLGIESSSPVSPALKVDSLPTEPPGKSELFYL